MNMLAHIWEKFLGWAKFLIRNYCLTIPLLLILVELWTIILRYLYFGSEGLIIAANDPGKVFFHLVILPACFYILLSGYPTQQVRKAVDAHPTLSIVIAGGLLVIAGLAVGSDIHGGFCKRSSVPTNIKDPGHRNRLFAVWKVGHDSINARANRPVLLKDTGNAKVREQAYLAYQDTLKRLERQPPCQGGFQCSFYHNASLESWLDVWLTFSVLVMAALLLFLFWALPAAGDPVKKEQWQALLVLLIVFSLWIPLKKYSEWYINFGRPTVSDYFLFYLAMGLIFVFAFWANARINDATQQGGAFALFIGMVPTVVSMLSDLKQEWFDSAAVGLSGLGIPEWIVFYTLLTMGTAGLVWYCKAKFFPIINSQQEEHHKV